MRLESTVDAGAEDFEIFGEDSEDGSEGDGNEDPDAEQQAMDEDAQVDTDDDNEE